MPWFNRRPKTAAAEAAAESAALESMRTWRRQHPLAQPFRTLVDPRLREITDGQRAFVASATDTGDLIERVGPDGTWTMWVHEPRPDGGHTWLEPADLGFGITEDATSWLTAGLKSPDAPTEPDAIADWAWTQLPAFYADRYDLTFATLPEPLVRLGGPAVLNEDGISQLLYDYARSGFEIVLAARGITTLDVDRT